MNSRTQAIIAGIVVVVVVAAAAGGIMYANRDKGSDVKITAALEVYGNADGDYDIDDDDVTIIKNIINNVDGYTLEKYPLADAYKDDKVDQKDVDQVEKIISGGDAGNQISIWHVNHTTDTKTYPNGQYVVETKWPVSKAIANGAANALIVYDMTGIRDKIVGVVYDPQSPPDALVYKHYLDMGTLGTSTMYPTESLVNECIQNNPGTTCIITADNKGYLDGTSGLSEADLEGKHIDVVRIQPAAVDPEEFGSSALLLGFLFQKDADAEKVVKWLTSVYNDLDEKLKDVKKTRVAATSYYYYLSRLNSDYASVVVQAGGEYVVPSGSSASAYFEDVTSSKTGKVTKADPNVLLPENQPDVIIALRTGAFLGSASNGASWYGDVSKWNPASMNSQLEHFSVFECYGQGKVYTISGDIPVVARVLYSAAILYPDIISMSYADEKHQEFVDTFLHGTYKVSDCHFVLTQKQIEDMKTS